MGQNEKWTKVQSFGPIFLRAPRAIMSKNQMGVGPPQEVKTKTGPKFTFSNLNSILEVCFVQIWAGSDEWKLS